MWTKREQSDKGEEMGKVIEQGLRKPAIATDIVGVVLEEVLREQARSGGSCQVCGPHVQRDAFPLMVAIFL